LLGDRTSFNFYYIKHGDSQTLSFYRLLADPDSLVSFRVLLEAVSGEHSRLLILFCFSLLWFRFCQSPLANCPLCHKQWLWEHFFVCPRLTLLPSIPSSSSLAFFKASVRSCDWVDVVQHVRFCLLQWLNAIPDSIVPKDVVDSLHV
jgi:hypothetical protein